MYYKLPMSEIAITVDSISKVYKLYSDPIDRLKESLNPFKKKYHRDFYALKGVSFKVKKGETLGIVGKNGSGKSTLLKILAGVLTQTSGGATVQGKVSSLLELGAGFNPELTGLENIYFNGSILGYSKKEIDQKLDDILAFADIGEFVRQPVKTYSSGMQVRLAFAVAINVDPQVLFIDEALAVGDIRFQQKCFRRLRDFKNQGKTILMVSHDSGAIINYCDRALWLRDGQIAMMGAPEEVTRDYVAYMALDDLTVQKAEQQSKKIRPLSATPSPKASPLSDVTSFSSFGKRGAEIKRVGLYSRSSDQKSEVLQGGESVSFAMEIIVHKTILRPLVGFIVTDRYGNQMFGINNHLLNLPLKSFHAGETKRIEFQFEFPFLRNGHYSFSPAIAEGTQASHIQHHWVYDAYVIQMANPHESARIGWYFLLQHSNLIIQ